METEPQKPKPPTSFLEIVQSEAKHLSPLVKPTETPKEILTLRKLATDALAQHDKAVKAYFALCVHIRGRQLAPDVVTRELKERGFADSRISEIKRVAFCTPQLFEQFRGGVVGFRYVLGAARAAAGKVTQPTLPGIVTPEAKLRRDVEEALSEIIPVAGPLPKLLRYAFVVRVNGYTVTLKLKKDKEAKNE